MTFPPPPGSAGPVPIPMFIEVGCTDKGRHRKLNIARFQKAGGEWGEPQKPDPGEGFGYAFRPLGGTHRFPCRRCGRDTHVNVDTLTKLFDGLTAARKEWLDISDLPF